MFDYDFIIYYDNEDPEPETNQEPEPEKEAKTPEKPPEKKFSQAEINNLLAEERRKSQRVNEKTVKQLEELKRNATLTEEEKKNLEVRIEDLKNEFLTKEEIAKKEARKDAEKIKKEKETLSLEAEKWKSKFTESTIETALMAAASANKAYNTAQLTKLLKPDTRLTEELDQDGQPTGKLIAKVRISTVDKEGKTIVLDLPATEAVKQLTELPEFANQFISGATSGFGGTNVSNISKDNKAPTDPAQYREWRKQNRNLVEAKNLGPSRRSRTS